MNVKPTVSVSGYSLLLGAFLLVSAFYASVLPSDTSPLIYLIVVLALTIDIFCILRTVQTLSQSSSSNRFSLEDIEGCLTSILGHSVCFLSKTFFATIFYAFLVRKYTSNQRTQQRTFSYENSANARDMFWIIAIAQIPTLPLIHVFIEKESNAAVAWIVTLLTGWTVIHYLAQIYSTKFNPITINNSELRYRYGLSWSANIPIELIKEARSLSFNDSYTGMSHFVSPIGSTKNVILEFKKPMTFKGQFGRFKRRSSAVISVDDPTTFLKALKCNSNTVT